MPDAAILEVVAHVFGFAHGIGRDVEHRGIGTTTLGAGRVELPVGPGQLEALDPTVLYVSALTRKPQSLPSNDSRTTPPSSTSIDV